MNKVKNHTPDALLNIALKLLDFGGKHCREVAQGYYAQGSREFIGKILFELLYIILKLFESVHEIRIYVRRGLLSLVETKRLRL